jgi:hypothetical protein
MLKQFVQMETSFEGIHNWPECPISEVSFLKYPHRHKIIIDVKIETTKDRQIEFYKLKMDVDTYIVELYGEHQIKQLGRRSMETISEELLKRIIKAYNLGRDVDIEVSASEDGQAKSIVQWVK